MDDIQDQINVASRHLASVTFRFGYNHQKRLKALELLKALQHERQLRKKDQTKKETII